ncbi:GreA/GreB family elongation factor [Amycolatopsis cynarae]|uniref:GreA/GreB family elongation factor n=1 Tax=Amycolatopsis cynarae TaxID=2995223 RepID=A0ABY7BBQ8_9PSEU|nr:GreA/GreB family elongation factor [Amycolatopsis sp. HUAS 11-8]WAL68311.1 GreA/GreB family elongation factor [Amycolatopsis sp. HUAS 11-8]
MANGKPAVSGEARVRLEQELATLRDRRAELAAEARALDRVGDRADDADALRLEDDIAALDARITQLSRVLAGARAGAGGVPDGTTVTVRFADGTVQPFRVVAVTEEIPAGQEDSTVTTDSPLGLALAGHQAGDTISYPAPAGEVRAEILSLELPS